VVAVIAATGARAASVSRASTVSRASRVARPNRPRRSKPTTATRPPRASERGALSLMRAIEITAPGGPEVLRETQRPDPVPAAGELRIRVPASGINRPDVLQRKGLYPMPPGVSDLPGLEIAGTVAGGAPADLAVAGVAL